MKRIYSEHLTNDEYSAWLDYMLLIPCPLCEHWHKNNSMSEALECLKKYNCLTEFKDVRLDMKDVEKPYIEFRCKDQNYKLILIKEEE